jgi:hypothetical protein
MLWESVVPVNGHWPSSRFCVTLSTVGSSRIRCSERREKPSNNPPHPAKRKSIPTKTIINLVGMLAVLVRYDAKATEETGLQKRLENRIVQRMEVERRGAVRRALG